MNSFLLVGEPKKTRKQAEKMAADFQAGSFDTLIISPDEETSPLSIALIRDLKRNLLAGPQQSKSRAVILERIDLATPQAQNALLKTLEEPPQATYLILTAPELTNVLETVISRCQLVKITTKNPITKEAFKLPEKAGERFELAENIAKSRAKAIGWCEEMLINLKPQLLSGQTKPETLRRIQRALTTLKRTNTSPRLLLENLFLEI